MPFPLLSLPIDLQILVLQTVDKTIDLISLSLCSKRAKTIVKSLRHLKLDLCEIWIKDGFHIHLHTGLCGLRFELTEVFTTGALVRVNETLGGLDVWDEFPKSWRVPDMTTRDWIDHLREVFLVSENSYIDFGGPFERDTLRMVLRGLDMKLNHIRNPLSDDHLKSALAVLPNAEELDLVQYQENIQFHDKKFIKKVSMQNYRRLDLIDFCPEHFGSLDNFLLINAKTVAHSESKFRKTDIDRFLKLWTRGAMRRLEYLFLDFSELIPDWDGFLEGMECVKIAEKEERTKTFQHSLTYRHSIVRNTEGIAIRRRTDGVIATFNYENGRFDFLFGINLFVV
uniref:F-box domain-containing protein n=1 Tax=Caenorhabditis tropicalis TaxID=1561998 RepID=A0A1I7TUN2_9PELO